MTATDHPYLVYSTPEGETRERRSLRACDYTGAPLMPNDLIPLPDGATLSMLPESARLHGADLVVAERDGEPAP